MEHLVKRFRSLLPHLSLGIAGGLGVKINYTTTHQLKRLMPLSVDAETGFAIRGKLDMKRVSDYLSWMLSAQLSSLQSDVA